MLFNLDVYANEREKTIATKKAINKIENAVWKFIR